MLEARVSARCVEGEKGRPTPVVVSGLRAAFTIAIVAGVVGSLALAWLPVTIAGSHFVVDDMSYYLTTARNVVSGRGVSFDGRNPTNGFHPLWLALVCGVEWLSGTNDALAFHLSLTLAVLGFLATGVLLCREVRDTGPRWLVVPFAVVFFCNYRLLSVPLSGLESGVAGLSVAAVAVAVARWADDLDLRRAMALGVLLGLAVLARMDALLSGGLVLVWLAWRAWLTRSWRRFGAAVVCGAAALLCLVPWFAFSWGAVHHWLPRSGEAIQTWMPSPWRRPWTSQGLATAVRVTLIGPAGNLANLLGISPIVNTDRVSHASGAMALLGVFAIMGWAAWRVREDVRVQRLSWVPVVVACHWAYYLRFAGDQQTRYLYPMAVLLFCFAAAVLGATIRTSGHSRGWLWATHAGATAMLLFVAVAGVDAYRLGVASGYGHRWHVPQYEGLAPWLETHTEPSAVVGAFNGGIVSFLSHRTVVNLDGVMNDNAIEALTARRLCDYIDSQRLTHLADNERSIEFFLDADPSCRASDWRRHWTVVHRVTWPPAGGSESLDWVVLARQTAADAAH